MGDVRFTGVYERLVASRDLLASLRSFSDADVIAALAGASRQADPYLANVLAVEAMNRFERREKCMEAMAEGVLGLDVDGVITFTNPSAEVILGAPRDALLGQRAHDLLHFDHGAHLGGDRCALERHPEKPVARRDFFARVGDGAPFPAVYTIAPLARDGAPDGAVVVFRNAEHEARVEQALRDALRAAQDAERRARFLAEAGEVLATAREPALALGAVARLAVPALADWCLVHARSADELALVAIETEDPERREELASLLPSSGIAAEALRRVAETGEPIIVGALSETALGSLQEPSLVASLRRMMPSGVLMVPIRGREAPRGVLTLVAGLDRGGFAPEDVRTAIDFARRAGVALEAFDLQRSGA